MPLLGGELPLVLLASLVAALLAWLEAPLALRLPLGLLGVLLLPGYSLSALLLPRADDLDGLERLALGFSLSPAVIAVVAPVLDRTPWGLGYPALVVSLTGWTVLAATAAWWRRERLAPSHGPAFTVTLRASRATWLALTALVGGLLLAAVALAMTLTASPPRLTEFFILGPDRLVENYPRQVRPGETVTVAVGITNHEGVAAAYSVEVGAGAATLARTAPKQMEAGTTWEGPVSFSLSRAGRDQEIQMRLLKDGNTQPYRQLRLWIDVLQAGSLSPVQLSGIAPASTAVTFDPRTGADILAGNVGLSFPPDSLAGATGPVTVIVQARPGLFRLATAPGGPFQFSANGTIFAVNVSESGTPIRVFAAPVTLLLRPNAADLAMARGDPRLLTPAYMIDADSPAIENPFGFPAGTWVRFPAVNSTVDPATGTIAVRTRRLSLVSLLANSGGYVQTLVKGAALWSSFALDAQITGAPKPQFTYLQVLAPQIGTRLLVLDPDTGSYAYVNAADVGPSGLPPGGVAAGGRAVDGASCASSAVAGGMPGYRAVC